MGEATMLLTWESTAEFFPVMGQALVCSGAVSQNLEPENKVVLQGSSGGNIYWTMGSTKDDESLAESFENPSFGSGQTLFQSHHWATLSCVTLSPFPHMV